MRSLVVGLTLSAILFPVLFSIVQAEEAGRAYYDFGVFAYEDGDYQDALENLAKALQAEPDNPYYLHYQGKTYLKLKDYGKARIALQAALAINPEIGGLPYDLAMVFYRSEDFAEAAPLFAEIVAQDPTNVLAQYHAGLSYYKKKQFPRALPHLLGASEKSPTITANCLYYAAICHLQMGDFDLAEERFNQVLDSQAPEVLKGNATKWLGVVQQQRQAFKPYHLRLDFKSSYNDNVRLEPLDRDDLFADEGDFFHSLLFSGKYNLINRPNRQAGIGLDHFQMWYHNLTAFDLASSNLRFFGLYRSTPLTYLLTYVPSHAWLNDEKYMMRQKITPELWWKVNDSLLCRFSYGYAITNNFQNDLRDGHANDVALNLNYVLPKKKAVLSGGLGREETSIVDRTENYETTKANLGISLPLPRDLNLRLTAKYHNRQYEQADPDLAGLTRHDQKYEYNATLSRPLKYKWLWLVMDFTYTKNNSTVNIYNYRKKMGGLSLSLRI